MKWKYPAAAALWLAAVSCCAQPNASAPTATSTQAQHEAGRKIYNFRCYFCHGYSGNAQTVAASFLTPPPLDFTGGRAARFTPGHIVSVLLNGKPKTAMPSFINTLTIPEIRLVAAFVMDEFVRRKAPNTRYHIPENGWPDHRRYQAAFPFATGEIPVSRPWDALNAEQVRGKRLFLSSCVTCHDRGDTPESGGTTQKGGAVWESRPLSFPRNNFSFTEFPTPDAMASASPYRLHDLPVNIQGMNAQEKNGQQLWRTNCAFCHAEDGTGKNWIGMFLEPHPRNLRDPAYMKNITKERLTVAIREGLPGASMPAWKSVLGDQEIAAVIAYISKAFYPVRR